MSSEESPVQFKSVLSAQSHVVHGYVGNRAGTFPLQLQGWDVDELNTVNLSNHTGYGQTRGTKSTAAEIKELYEGLMTIGVKYDAFLTGYAPNAESVTEIAKIGRDLRDRFPGLLWLLDPVLGDDGRLYVSDTVIPVYREILKSGAVTLITPNQFEAETLTGRKITSRADVLETLQVLHTEYKVPNVVLSSVTLPGSDLIYSIGSTVCPTTNAPRAFFYAYPALKSYFTGTGDLFAAMTIDRFHKYTGGHPTTLPAATVPAVDLPLAKTVGEVLGVVQGVLARTWKNSSSLTTNPGAVGNIESMRNSELQVIQSRDLISATTSPYSPQPFQKE